MTGTLAGAVLIVVAAGYLLACFGRWMAAQWFLVRMWRWLSGEAHHGKPITDAGWGRAGQRALTRTGHAGRWWHLPREQRAAWRTGGTLAAAGMLFGFLANPQVTASSVLALLCALCVFSGWRTWRRFRRRRQERTWLLPLHLAAHDLAGIPRAQRAASWIKAELDGSGAVRKATLELPQGWPADSKDEARLVAITAAKLGIEAPDPSWRRAGQAPQLCLTHSEPPPSGVAWDDVAEAVQKARAEEIVCGIGKKNAIVKVSKTLDSPHFAVNMGTGAGKSSLAAFWLMQELRRGAIAMVLDSKWFSHPWLFKDEDGNYAQLPNVAYLSSPAQIHAGMEWLGAELDRRNQVARRAVTASGHMRANVGPDLIIVAEELNYATPQLRQYWSDIRDPSDVKKSPALTSFGAVSFAGRAVKMRLFLIGQMITAEVTGGRDSSVKENVGVTAMARYGPPGWATAVGKNVPMPPSPEVLGRIQLVTAGKVREVQTPKPDLLLYRRLVLEGEVTPCPAGMPGAARVLDAPQLPGGGSDVPVVPGTRPPLGQPGALLTLSEAVSPAGPLSCSLHAARKASQRPGFPVRRGMRGQAGEYDAVELAEWQEARHS